jgi:hypothetical protein
MNNMTQFAPVCPIHILEGLKEDGTGGMYHLPLAHDVLNHKERYKKFFGSLWEYNWQNPAAEVILDNSVIELGSAVDIDVIAKAAETVRASVIVLPDVLLNGAETIASCRTAAFSWTPILNGTLGKNNWTYMVVPQGKTIEEFTMCAEQLRDIENTGWWGVPRNFRINNLGSRKLAVDICQMLNPDRKIHLLGFSDDLIDDFLSAKHPRVSGIDSAVPIRAASYKTEMSLTFGDKLPPRGDWWENAEYTPLMGDNVETVRRYLSEFLR